MSVAITSAATVMSKPTPEELKAVSRDLRADNKEFAFGYLAEALQAIHKLGFAVRIDGMDIDTHTRDYKVGVRDSRAPGETFEQRTFKISDN